MLIVLDQIRFHRYQHRFFDLIFSYHVILYFVVFAKKIQAFKMTFSKLNQKLRIQYYNRVNFVESLTKLEAAKHILQSSDVHGT